MLVPLVGVCVGVLVGKVFPSIGVPTKLTLFEGVSYFSMLYFVVDYVLPKACSLFSRIAESSMKGMEVYFRIKTRYWELRENFERARQRDVQPPALASSPVRE